MVSRSREAWSFWQAHRMKPPGWAREYALAVKTDPRVIHRLVNQNAGIRMTGECQRFAASNLCALVRLWKRNHPGEEVRGFLLYLALKPGTLIDADRRAGFAAKWWTRLTQGRV